MPAVLADGAPEVDAGAKRVGAKPAGWAKVERKCELANGSLGRGDLVDTHCLEIHALQSFLVADGEHRVDPGRLVFGGVPACAGRSKRFGDPPAGRVGAFGALLLAGFHQGHRRRLPRGFRVAPEQGEGLVEHLGVLVAMDHRRFQRGSSFALVAKINQRQGAHGRDRF